MTAALALACVAVDAVATWILLAGSPLQPPLGGFVAAASHGTAVLLLSRLDRGRPSRRWLGVAAMLARIDDWRDAPLWDPDSISRATRCWFDCLSAA